MRIKFLVLILLVDGINMPMITPKASAQGVWSYDTSTLFTARCQFSSDTLSGKVYVVGGDELTDPLQIFDPVLHSWTTPVTKGTFTFAPEMMALTCVFIGKLLVVDFDYHGTVKEFDPSTSTWSTLATSGKFTPRAGACGAMVNGKLYVIGGDTTGSSSSYTNIVEVFDPSNNTWSRPVTTGEFGGVSPGRTCSAVDGKIYIIGSPVNVFDPSSNTWSTIETIGTVEGGDNATSSTLDGKIYVFGGGGSFSSDASQVFDPATNTWSSLTPLPEPRSMLSSCVLDGKIYVLGGYYPHQVYNNVWIFTPGANDVSSSPASSSSFVLSPNPTDGIITVHAGNTLHVTIENLLGARVLEIANPRSPDFTLDLSKLPSGLYFARFEMAGTVVMRKIVKE